MSHCSTLLSRLKMACHLNSSIPEKPSKSLIIKTDDSTSLLSTVPILWLAWQQSEESHAPGCQLQVTLYDSGHQHFFGRTWKSGSHSVSGTAGQPGRVLFNEVEWFISYWLMIQRFLCSSRSAHPNVISSVKRWTLYSDNCNTAVVWNFLEEIFTIKLSQAWERSLSLELFILSSFLLSHSVTVNFTGPEGSFKFHRSMIDSCQCLNLYSSDLFQWLCVGVLKNRLTIRLTRAMYYSIFAARVVMVPK